MTPSSRAVARRLFARVAVTAALTGLATTPALAQARWTADQVRSFLPERGDFTFPAPYGTAGVRITNPSDCGGTDCVQPVGGASWRNIDAHGGRDSLLIFLGLRDVGPTLFRYDKRTGRTENLGPLFAAKSPFATQSGEGWYFSARRPATLYLTSGAQLLRYDVLARTFETALDAATEFGEDREIGPAYSSDDDNVHSAALRDSASGLALGCIAYREDLRQFSYHPTNGALAGCEVDKSGRWLVIKENADGLAGVDNRIVDLETGAETLIPGQDGAGGHSANGFGYLIAADNGNGRPGGVRAWSFDQNPPQGELVYGSPFADGVDVGALAHSSAGPGVPMSQQHACVAAKPTTLTEPASEIVCFRLDASGNALALAQSLAQPVVAGGESAPEELPTGNLDVTGRYFLWAGRTGDRSDAFMVKVPEQLTVPEPLTTDDLTCPGSPVAPGAAFSTTISGGSSNRDWVASYVPGTSSTTWVGASKYVPLPRPATVPMNAPSAVGPYELRLHSNDTYTLIGSCTYVVGTGSTLSINDLTVTEGNSGTTSATFSVALSAAATEPVTVSFATANGTATAGSDYVANSGTLTFSPGETIKTVTVLVNGDTTSEANETFFVNLSAPSGATISDNQGQGTITNDDGTAPPLTCPGTVGPGAAFSTTISVGSSNRDWVASYVPGTSSTTWVGASKYVPLPRPATVPMNAPSAVGPYELRLHSNDTYTLIGSCTYVVGTGSTLSINDLTVTEGNSGTTSATFSVALSAAATGPVTVSFATANGTATAGSDYVANSGTLTFNPGETVKTVTVLVNGDTTSEANETFFVNLSAPSGATVSDSQGQGTITNDDGSTPALTCPGTVGPGAAFSTTISVGSSNRDWVASYVPGASSTTWVGASKYVPLPRPATVPMNAPSAVGPYELRLHANDTYSVIGSCTYVVGTGSTLSINDLTVTEGNSGTTSATFSVALSAAATGPVTVSFATANGTATAGSDYVANSGTLTFSPGETIKTVTVLVNGDTTSEANETFFVNLSAPSGATISDSQGQGTITNDDGTSPPLTCPGMVEPGAAFSTTISAGSSNRDWVASYVPGTSSTTWVGVSKYVPLPRPATVPMNAPSAVGPYELRLHANDTYTLIGSCTYQVASAGDTTPPLISGVGATSVGATSATITWTTDEPADTQIDYGTTTAYGSSTTLNTSPVVSHSQAVSGLTAGTLYHYRVKSRDAAGNLATSADFTFTTLDTTPPSVSITTPAGGATVSGTVTVAANASDNVAVAGVQFKLDGANLGVEDTTSPYSVSWNTTTATNGSHTLTAVARDAAGNTTTSAGVTVTVTNDTTPPSVSITAPAGGATVTGTLPVTANASDNVAVAGVQFKLDGANLGAEDTTSPYSVSWNTTTAANGSHTLTAVARDAAGNTTTSAAVTVTVANDTTPPSVSITAPAGGATVSGTLPVTANASDNVAVAGVQFKLDGANLGAEDTTSPYSVSWNTTTAANGSHTLTAVARDAAGNTTTSAAVTVTVANGGVVTLSPQDTFIKLDTSNQSTNAQLITYTWPDNQVANAILMKFDLSPISPAAVVTDATLQLALVESDTAPESTYTMTAHKLVGRNPVIAAATGYTADGVTPWTPNSCCSGGVPLAQADISVPYDSRGIDKALGYKSWSITAMAQEWVANPATNFGLLLNADTSKLGDRYRAFASIEHASPSLRPFLSITYSLEPDTTPPLISAVLASALTASGATITWTTNEPSDTQVEYGTTTAYGSLSTLNASLLTAHLATLGGLSPSTLYHYRVRSRDFAGNLALSGDFTFTTLALDLTPPTVSITAPAAGATVVGTVPVTANATDNVAVVGVQFKLDGANLGAEDTTAPYSHSWNTTAASNGSHTLTAVARDAAGNTRTSAGVAVTVDNAAGPAWPNEPSGFTPIEETGWEGGTLGNWYRIFTSSDKPITVKDVPDSVIGESKTLEIGYAVGHVGGGGTELRYDIPGALQSNELFVGYYVQVNSLWQGHSSGINKMVYLHDGGGSFSAMWYEIFGSGSSLLDLYVVNQSGSGPAGFHENVNEITFVRGVWHKVEIYQKQGASNNGIVRVWVNGVLAIDRSDVDTRSTPVDNITISGIWGGVGDSKDQADYMRFDRIRISKPGP